MKMKKRLLVPPGVWLAGAILVACGDPLPIPVTDTPTVPAPTATDTPTVTATIEPPTPTLITVTPDLQVTPIGFLGDYRAVCVGGVCPPLYSDLLLTRAVGSLSAGQHVAVVGVYGVCDNPDGSGERGNCQGYDWELYGETPWAVIVLLVETDDGELYFTPAYQIVDGQLVGLEPEE